MVNKFLLTAVLFSAFSFLIYMQPVNAAELRSGVEVLIGPEEVINEDVYAFGARIVVEGTINGDFVAAGESIEINGAVNGDLIVAGRFIGIDGAVEDDIRAAGTDLQFSSDIGGDLITAGYEVNIESGAIIGEDVVAGANTVIASGEIEGDMDLNVVEATIAGTVQGNVDATVEDRLTLGPESTIAGALNYTSENEVSMEPGATVVGEVTQQIPAIVIFGNEFQASVFIDIVSTILEQAKWFLGTVLVGIVLIWLFPQTIHNVVATLLTSPWRCLGMGLLILPLTPILLLLTMIILLSILGFSAFPIVALPAMLYGALLLVAKPVIAIPIGGYLSKRFTKRDHYIPVKALVVGAALLALLGCIPIIDSIVGWLTLLFGLGMWLLFLYRYNREARSGQAV